MTHEELLLPLAGCSIELNCKGWDDVHTEHHLAAVADPSNSEEDAEIGKEKGDVVSYMLIYCPDGICS